MNKIYQYNGGRRNDNYEKGLVNISLRSCLIRHNSEIIIKTEPKWITEIKEYTIAKEGEVVEERNIISNEMKRTNGRKIKVLQSFFNQYEQQYKEKKITIFWFVFTKMDTANITFSRMIENVRNRFSSLGVNTKGYVWTFEVSSKFHLHYNLLVATDRYDFKGKILNELKFEKLWGNRTYVEPLQTAKGTTWYLSKTQAQPTKFRTYGKSKFK